MSNNVHTKYILDEENKLIDVEIITKDKNFLMLGSVGARREESLLTQYENKNNTDILPVFIGFGVGHGIALFLEKTKNENKSIAIIDKEEFIHSAEYSNIREEILNNPRVTLITDNNPRAALVQLTQWQVKNDNLPFFPLVNSQYLRIDNEFYKEIQKTVTASQKFNFWAKARKKRFQNKEVTFLFIASKYFLMGELVSACERIGVKSKLLILEDDKLGKEEFISLLLEHVIEIQPDAIFTLNHLGMDSAGVLTDLLERLELPLISWFLDNPHLVLHEHDRLRNDWLTIMTYDKDNVPSLHKAGFSHAYYMPLGTDTERFHPRNALKEYPKIWDTDVSFVGNSMRRKVASRLVTSNPPKELRNQYKELSKEFAVSPMHSVREFMEEHYPSLMYYYHALDTLERRQAFEALVTWDATRLYRQECVEQILEFDPIIVGDPSWQQVFRGTKHNITYLEALSYYDLLPNFYTHSKINFNTTSKQMKNAINQRIFDVTATGSFVLTDWREQMDELLVSGKEIISYKEMDEIPDLIRFYLKHENERNKIVEKGRARVLAEHSWEKRIEKIIQIMRNRYA